VVMGKKYNQLKIDERGMIAVLRAEGKSAREIGRELGRSHSTIVRELKNNSAPVNKGYYLSHKAQERAEGRKRNAGVRVHLKSEHIRTYVESSVKRGWSAVQIAGRLSIDNPGLSISHEAIYQYIYIDAPDLIGYLARRHKKRHLKGQGRKHKKHISPIESVLMSVQRLLNSAMS
jgi:IS30 family transposase